MPRMTRDRNRAASGRLHLLLIALCLLSSTFVGVFGQPLPSQTATRGPIVDPPQSSVPPPPSSSVPPTSSNPVTPSSTVPSSPPSSTASPPPTSTTVAPPPPISSQPTQPAPSPTAPTTAAPLPPSPVVITPLPTSRTQLVTFTSNGTPRVTATVIVDIPPAITSTPVTGAVPIEGANDPGKNAGKKTAIIVGSVIGGLFSMAVIGLVGTGVVRWRQRARKGDNEFGRSKPMSDLFGVNNNFLRPTSPPSVQHEEIVTSGPERPTSGGYPTAGGYSPVSFGGASQQPDFQSMNTSMYNYAGSGVDGVSSGHYGTLPVSGGVEVLPANSQWGPLGTLPSPNAGPGGIDAMGPGQWGGGNLASPAGPGGVEVVSPGPGGQWIAPSGPTYPVSYTGLGSLAPVHEILPVGVALNSLRNAPSGSTLERKSSLPANRTSRTPSAETMVEQHIEGPSDTYGSTQNTAAEPPAQAPGFAFVYKAAEAAAEVAAGSGSSHGPPYETLPAYQTFARSDDGSQGGDSNTPVAASDSKHMSEDLGQRRVATMAFKPSQPDEVVIIPGDTVVITQAFSDGWCTGTNLRTGQHGAFPMTILAPQSSS
ncbi:hypothetical protein SpCBS45565_g01031 [Spizellomyces sp. 'palustris']|nr:hypothetical protein SpCBS45565_g01031 [Spizellomyces sp. 'palustris']